MKKSLGLKICASILAVPFLASFAHGALAADADPQLIIDDLDIYNPLQAQSNSDDTATYDPSTGILTLDGYKGGAISSNLPKLTIKVEKDSSITDITKTLVYKGEDLTITGGTLTLSNGLDSDGRVALESGTLNLGTSDLTAKGNISIKNTVVAGSILVNAASPTNAKIIITEKANVTVSKTIAANYTTETTTKGIEINKVCAKPAASIVNISGTGSVKTQTVFSVNERTAVNTGLNISNANCGTTPASSTTTNKTSTETEKNPNTADNVALYVAALVASSAILIFRRHLAKR